MSRVADAIDAAAASGRGAFVGYLPLGYPDLETSIDVILQMGRQGDRRGIMEMYFPGLEA